MDESRTSLAVVGTAYARLAASRRLERTMPNNKDFAKKNAHERTSPDESSAGARERQEQERADSKKDEKNPLARLRFGSAGSGGAELEPGPERP
jgi:hypothetical protein